MINLNLNLSCSKWLMALVSGILLSLDRGNIRDHLLRERLAGDWWSVAEGRWLARMRAKWWKDQMIKWHWQDWMKELQVVSCVEVDQMVCTDVRLQLKYWMRDFYFSWQSPVGSLFSCSQPSLSNCWVWKERKGKEELTGFNESNVMSVQVNHYWKKDEPGK